MNPTCCICLEDLPYVTDDQNACVTKFLPRMTYCCGNIMHARCNDDALNQLSGCPLCRSMIMYTDEKTLIAQLREKVKQKSPWATWLLGFYYMEGEFGLQKSVRLGFEFQYRGLCLEHDHTSSRFLHMAAASDFVTKQWAAENVGSVVAHNNGRKVREVELCYLLSEFQYDILHCGA